MSDPNDLYGKDKKSDPGRVLPDARPGDTLPVAETIARRRKQMDDIWQSIKSGQDPTYRQPMKRDSADDQPE